MMIIIAIINMCTIKHNETAFSNDSGLVWFNTIIIVMTTKQQIPTTTSIGQHCSTTKRRFSVTFLFSSAQYWYMGKSLPTSRPASIWELLNMFDPLSSKKRRQWQKIGNMYSFLARLKFYTILILWPFENLSIQYWHMHEPLTSCLVVIPKSRGSITARSPPVTLSLWN